MTFHDWWTNENNPSLPKNEYLYGTNHIITLVVTVIACLVFGIVFYKKSEKTKNIFFYVMGSILLFFEIASRVVNLIIEETYTWESVLKILLPMHMCSVMVWIFIIAIFSRNQMLINFSAVGGVLATVAFLLYPAVGLNRTYFSFTCAYSVISHVTGFVTAVMLMVLGKAKFEFKKIWQMFLCFGIMFAWGALLNWVIFPGSDYMYLRNDPLELPINFPYQILYAGILIVYIMIFYVVYAIVQWIKKKKQSSHKST